MTKIKEYNAEDENELLDLVKLDNGGDMNKPFEGIEFNITELSQDLELSKSNITEIVDKFVDLNKNRREYNILLHKS